MTIAAAASTEYRTRRYGPTSVPTRFERHMMDRLGCGYSRATFAQMRRAGGPMAWFEQQLDPASVREPKIIAAIDSWFPDLEESMERKWRRNKSGSKPGWKYGVDFGNWTMLRRMHSNRQLLENMVGFWSDHLHVPAFAERAWIGRKDMDTLIRRHALGRFDKLLVQVTLSPSMLVYLDNYRSVRKAPNENHGRELLELHTVGPGSGYTEEMVKDSAVILSGWTVHAFTRWSRYYSRKRHRTGRVRVLGFSRRNASSNGKKMSRAYLRYLARHPATARNIARKLATHFVSDTPSEALVEHLAKVYRDSGTDITATLRALVAHPEFRTSYGAKVRTPVEDLVATARVLQTKPSRPVHGKSFARAITYVHGGDRLYSWPRPDGAPHINSVWCSASRMLSSYRMHWQLAGGYYPRSAVRYRKHTFWLPKSRIRFDRFVDHLSRMVLGQKSTPLILQAACEATGMKPGTKVHARHRVLRHDFVKLMAALLDSPIHMTR